MTKRIFNRINSLLVQSLILLIFSSASEENERVQRSTEDFTPRHVHLSLRFEDTMTVTWSTKDRPDLNLVEFGVSENALTKTQSASRTDEHRSKNHGHEDNVQYIHEATLRDVVPGRTYYYRCVSDRNGTPRKRTSKTYKFRVPKSGTEWLPNLIVYGDLGYKNAASVPFLQNEVLTEKWDAIVHVGDIGYDLHSHGGETGDNFMELIEGIAARVPYHVCPGNHEITYKSEKDGSHGYDEYKARFRMADPYDSMMYTWNLGPVHFISFNTENYFHTEKYIQRQHDWLKNALEEANRNRVKRPWVIVYAHTPMYCQKGSQNCAKSDNPVRVGSKTPSSPSLEDLFMNNGVDLLLWGHSHYYQSSFPMYNYKVYNSTTSRSNPYKNPKALVHIISGVAGSKLPQNGFGTTKPEWTRFRSTNFGYTRLEFKSKTELSIEQVDVTTGTDKVGKVIDRITLIRDNHEKFRIP